MGNVPNSLAEVKNMLEESNRGLKALRENVDNLKGADLIEQQAKINEHLDELDDLLDTHKKAFESRQGQFEAKLLAMLDDGTLPPATKAVDLEAIYSAAEDVDAWRIEKASPQYRAFRDLLKSFEVTKSGMDEMQLKASLDAGRIITPAETSARLLRAELELSWALKHCTVVPINKRSWKLREFGRLTVYWGERADMAPEDFPAMQQLDDLLSRREVWVENQNGDLVIPRTVVEDADVDLVGTVRDQFAEDFSEDLDIMVQKGTGHANKQFDGLDMIANANAGELADIILKVQAKAAGGIDWEDIIDLQEAPKARYARRGRWWTAQANRPALRKLKSPQGEYYWSNRQTPTEDNYLYGAPIDAVPGVDLIPPAGTAALPLWYGDPKTIMLRPRLQLLLDMDKSAKQRTDTYCFIRRIGMTPFKRHAIAALEVPAA